MSQTGVAIAFPAGSGTAQREGYLVRPDGDGPFPGVVIIHEIFGLNENIRDIAHRFANEGYVALAVDLFAGRNRTVCMVAASWGKCCSARSITAVLTISNRP